MCMVDYGCMRLNNVHVYIHTNHIQVPMDNKCLDKMLGKRKEYSPKWWINGNLPCYKVEKTPEQKSKNGGLIASFYQWIYGQQFLGPLTAKIADDCAKTATRPKSDPHGEPRQSCEKNDRQHERPMELVKLRPEKLFGPTKTNRTVCNPELVDEKWWKKPLREETAM